MINPSYGKRGGGYCNLTHPLVGGSNVNSPFGRRVLLLSHLIGGGGLLLNHSFVELEGYF